VQFAYEKRDCSVRALRIAIGRSYEEAHRALEASGRLNKRGAYNRTVHIAAQLFGLVPIDDAASGGPSTPTLAQFVRAHREGRYVIRINTHFLALVDGVVHDNFPLTGPRTRVTAAWGKP
jgi:hypothetical protein